jgi:hypothetical protein
MGGNLHVWKLDIDHLSLWSLSYGKLAGFVAFGIEVGVP